MKKIDLIKKAYPPGTKVILEYMEGESQMPAGLKGTVKAIDAIGQIHVSWENGSSLALNFEVDEFHKDISKSLSDQIADAKTKYNSTKSTENKPKSMENHQIEL